MRYFSFLLGIFFCLTASGQEVLLSEKVKRQQQAEKKLDRYTLFNFGLITGRSGSGLPVHYGNSVSSAVGIGFRYKFSKLFSAGIEAFYQENRFKLRQEQGNVFPDSMLHIREILRIQQPGAGIYFRINFDPGRKDGDGKYIDLAFRANWQAGGRHITFDEVASPWPAGAKRVKSIYSGLTYLERFIYGPELRLGTGHISLFGRYRMVPSINNAFGDLPQFTFGIRIHS